MNRTDEALDTSHTHGNAAFSTNPTEDPCAGGNSVLSLLLLWLLLLLLPFPPRCTDESRSSSIAIANFDDMCARDIEPEEEPVDEMYDSTRGEALLLLSLHIFVSFSLSASK